MTYQLPALPYAHNALEPHISEETLNYHYDKHHATYVKKLNGLTPGTEFEGKSLEEIIRTAPAGGIFNNAAQVWNHTFYWHSLSPQGGGEPHGKAADQIAESFGSFADFKEKFTNSAVTNFGSGWTWLIVDDQGKLQIVNTSNADTPLAHNQKPVLTVDVWEHAYYIDYRNARPKYLEAFWQLVNWDFVNQNLSS